MRIARSLYREMEFVFECTWFRDKHWQDWEFVSDTLGVDPVKLDAGTVAAAWRKRAFWASFPMLELLRREAQPEGVLEDGTQGSMAVAGQAANDNGLRATELEPQEVRGDMVRVTVGAGLSQDWGG